MADRFEDIECQFLGHGQDYPPKVAVADFAWLVREVRKLRDTRTRLLATVRMLSMDEATAEEVGEIREQVAALIAEVGTLRSELREGAER